MSAARLRPALPYLVGLVVAAALYYAADHIAYTPRGSELGPDMWPQGRDRPDGDRLSRRDRAGARRRRCDARRRRTARPGGRAGAPPQRRSWSAASCWSALRGPHADRSASCWRPSCSSALLHVSRALSQPRRDLVAVSVLVTVLIAFLFLRFAYVSLPRGVPPFDRFTDLDPHHAGRLSAGTRASMSDILCQLGARLRELPHPVAPRDARRRHRHRAPDRRAAGPDAGDGRRARAALHLQAWMSPPRSCC